MTESVDLRSIERRPQQYWNVDGLPELMMGLLWVVWGGTSQIGQWLPRGPMSTAYRSFTPFLLVVSALAITWAIKKLKARITFPRTGYVEWQAPARSRTLVAAAVAMVAAGGLVFMSRRVSGVDALAAPGIGLLFSLGFVGAALTQRLPHLLVLAATALVLGFLMGAWHAGWDAVNWLLMALGAGTMITGALRLRTFLRRNPGETPA